jgi:signal peptidase
MKVFKIIKNILLDILILLLLCLVAFSILNRSKPVPIFGYYLLTVKTGSMESTFSIGDYIIVKESNNYKVGDIVTYKNGKVYVTHRIIKINGNKVITKGDANNALDPLFNKNKIIGKFVYKSDLLNFVIRYRLVIVLVIVILYLLYSIIKNRNRKVISNVT